MTAPISGEKRFGFRLNPCGRYPSTHTLSPKVTCGRQLLENNTTASGFIYFFTLLVVASLPGTSWDAGSVIPKEAGLGDHQSLHVQEWGVQTQTGVPHPHGCPPHDPIPHTGSHSYNTRPSIATSLVSCLPHVRVTQGGQVDAASLPVAASSSTTPPFHLHTPTTHKHVWWSPDFKHTNNPFPVLTPSQV